MQCRTFQLPLAPNKIPYLPTPPHFFYRAAGCFPLGLVETDLIRRFNALTPLDGSDQLDIRFFLSIGHGRNPSFHFFFFSGHLASMLDFFQRTFVEGRFPFEFWPLSVLKAVPEFSGGNTVPYFWLSADGCFPKFKFSTFAFGSRLPQSFRAKVVVDRACQVFFVERISLYFFFFVMTHSPSNFFPSKTLLAGFPARPRFGDVPTM